MDWTKIKAGLSKNVGLDDEGDGSDYRALVYVSVDPRGQGLNLEEQMVTKKAHKQTQCRTTETQVIQHAVKFLVSAIQTQKMLMLFMTQTVGHHVVTPGPPGQKEKGDHRLRY